MVTITAADIADFKHEAGGHRIQRIPDTEKRGRIHTSTITVAVLFDHQQSSVYNQRSKEDFSYRWFSGTGKGGQKRNKTQSCLVITHVPTGLTQRADGRSREHNEAEAMSRLIMELDRLNNEQSAATINEKRSQQLGSGMRGDKRRTYRFQDDTVVDHLTGQKMSCKKFMRGDIDSLWPKKDSQ